MIHRNGNGDLSQLVGESHHLRPLRRPRARAPRVTVPRSVALILERLETATDGVGSGTLQLFLRDNGISASQPTVGRILKELDHAHLTEKVSNRGRVLTHTGRRQLELIRFEANRRQWVEDLITTLEPATRADFLPILEGLRAIESEIARLAAERATDEQLAEMRTVVEEQHQRLEAPLRGAEQGTDFHKLLALAARNRFLELAGRILWEANPALHDLWYEANLVTGTSSYPSHVRILEAVIARNPRSAQRAMCDHFDDFARAVERHIERVAPKEAAAHPTGAAARH